MNTLPLLAAAALAATAAPLLAQPAHEVPPPHEVGRTTLEISRDPIDDSVRAFVNFRADGGRLSIGCNRDDFRGIRISLSDRGWFASRLWTGRRQMQWRFDEARRVNRQWRTDEGTIYTSNRGTVRNFLRWMAGSDRLAMRAQDVEKESREFLFSIAGARTPIEQMLEACGETELLAAVRTPPAAEPQRRRRRLIPNIF